MWISYSLFRIFYSGNRSSGSKPVVTFGVDYRLPGRRRSPGSVMAALGSDGPSPPNSALLNAQTAGSVILAYAKSRSGPLQLRHRFRQMQLRAERARCGDSTARRHAQPFILVEALATDRIAESATDSIWLRGSLAGRAPTKLQSLDFESNRPSRRTANRTAATRHPREDLSMKARSPQLRGNKATLSKVGVEGFPGLTPSGRHPKLCAFGVSSSSALHRRVEAPDLFRRYRQTTP